MQLTDEPQELISGLRAWRNHNGFVCALLHFTADPSSPQEEDRRRGMPDEQRFKREHMLDFTSWAGQAVYPGYNDTLEVVFEPSHNMVVWRAFDFGYHHPAVVYAQVHGGLWVFGEIMGEDETLEEFIVRKVEPYEASLFANWDPKPKFIDAADVAGRQVTDKSEFTSFTILGNHGIYPLSKKTEINEGLTIIRQKIAEPGGFLVHPRCRILIEALKGGYRYPEPTPGTPEPMYPLKDGFFEHPMDSLRYIAVNAMSLYVKKEKKKEEDPFKNLPDRLREKLTGRVKGNIDPDLGKYY